jgi:hypothetical protein
MRIPGRVRLSGILLAAGIVSVLPPVYAQDDELFEKRVRPILANNCYPCHGPASGGGQAGLRLDSLAGMLKGGRSGPALVPGEPDRSLFIHAVNHDTFVQMPPKTKLPLSAIRTLTRWVEAGAPWPNSPLPAQPEPRAEDSSEQPGFSDEQKTHWAFQRVRRHRPPEVTDSEWPRSPIDRFLLAALEAKGLRPAHPADKRTLIRRATIDLHGVPPTPTEVDDFLADDTPRAFAKVIDRLLASPRYGERWGRHWLDVARYADSNGMDDNIVHGDAWRYRDYVIKAFNDDKPYDQFVREQLAGDLMTKWGDDNRAEGLIATGFLMLGPKMVGEDDPVKQKLDFADEQLATTSRAFMALTLDCARCHDHKFDPIPTQDYYSLLGIFASTKTVLTYRVTSKLNATALDGPEDEERLSEIENSYDFHDDFVTNSNSATTPKEVLDEHKEAIKLAKEQYESIPKAMAVGEGEIEDLPVMIRGSHLTPGGPAPRRFPRILADGRDQPIGPDRSGRFDLARWLTEPDHPLTARVMVNRIWKGHFGEGIVRSTDNFGLVGDRPDNLPLLDWLAERFVESGWSIKAMQRLIMLSSAYRMGSAPHRPYAEVDPENRLLWRMNRRRMEAEVIRDSLLAVSGKLEHTAGGKTLPHANFVNLNDGKSRDPELYASSRRSVYLPVLRSALYEVFETFDFANPSTINGRRSSTTVAPQALFMMNSDLMDRASLAVAERVLRQSRRDADRLWAAYRLVHLRSPDRDESERWMGFLKRYEQALAATEGDATERRKRVWQALCRVLLASNEFTYVM